MPQLRIPGPAAAAAADCRNLTDRQIVCRGPVGIRLVDRKDGTFCQGKASKSWEEKAKACRKCEVFQSVFDLPQGYTQSHRSIENIRPESKLALH